MRLRVPPAAGTRYEYWCCDQGLRCKTTACFIFLQARENILQKVYPIPKSDDQQPTYEHPSHLLKERPAGGIEVLSNKTKGIRSKPLRYVDAAPHE